MIVGGIDIVRLRIKSIVKVCMLVVLIAVVLYVFRGILFNGM